MSVCNHCHSRRVKSGKITTFRGVHFLTPACAGLPKSSGSKLELLKSGFNAKNLMCRLVIKRTITAVVFFLFQVFIIAFILSVIVVLSSNRPKRLHIGMIGLAQQHDS